MNTVNDDTSAALDSLRKMNTYCYKAAVAIGLLALVGCGGSQDLRGKATLKVTGDCKTGGLLRISVNGVTLGDEIGITVSKEFTFDNAKDGDNKLVLKIIFQDGTSTEKTFKFNALPGGITKVVLKIESSTDFNAFISTEKQGTDPATLAAINAAKERTLAEEKDKKDRETAERERQTSALEAELRKFAKEFVPDLQQAIDMFEEQIKQFNQQRITFAQEMNKLGVDPDKRPAYRQKGEIIEKMKQDASKLVADRQETYIKWKELNLLRDSADTKGQRDILFQNAQKAANSAKETFNKYMEQSRDTDGK